MDWIDSALSSPSQSPTSPKSLSTQAKPLDEGRDAPPSSGWIDATLEQPQSNRSEDRPGILSETGKAVGRGFASAGKNLLVNAPEAYMNWYEHSFPTWLGGVQKGQQEQDFERGKKMFQEYWAQPLREMYGTAERFWASKDSHANDPFFTRLRHDPVRTLSTGLAENAPQLLITIGASAVNPALGIGMAGAQEGGSAWEEAKQAGASDEQAAYAAGLTALPNMILEYLPAGRLVGKVFKKVPKSEVAGVFRGILKQAAAEGSTELIQEANSVFAGLATYAGEKGLTWNDVKSMFSSENLQRYGAAGLLGAVMGGAVHGVAGHGGEHHAGDHPQIDSQGRPHRVQANVHEDPAGLEGTRIDVRDKIREAETQDQAKKKLATQPPPEPTPPPERPEARVLPFPQDVSQETQGGQREPRAGASNREGELRPAREATSSEPPPPASERGQVGQEGETTAPASRDQAPPTSDGAAIHAQQAKPEHGAGEAGNRPRFELGASSKAYTERASGIDFDYALADARDLVTSHDEHMNVNPAYPQEVQPRDRSRAASETQVARIANQLNPELLGESPKVSDGAPIVGTDGVVESGNARSIGIKRAYSADGESATKYRAWLRDNAPKFGLTAEQADSFEQPVLVRVRRTEVDRAAFGREANESAIASMSATERARADAQRLTPEMLDSLRVPESGEVNWTHNKDFVHGFMSDVAAANEHGAMFDDRGELSVEGQQRMRNAVLAKAYGDAAGIAKLIEHSDNNVRNVGNAFMREAPRIARMRADIERGQLHPLDITSDAMSALRKLSNLREGKATVGDYLRQSEMFHPELSPEARELLGAFDAHARSSKQIGDILHRYTEIVEGLGNPNQRGLFGEAESVPSKLEIIREAIATKDSAGQRELFDKGVPGSAAGAAFVEPATPGTLNRRPGTPPPPPPLESPGRRADPRPQGRLVELPEIVEILQHLGKGRLPKIKRALRAAQGQALGAFSHPKGGEAGVEVRADLAKDPHLSAYVLAHELGHWVDHVPQGTLARGNVLGHLASLSRYMKEMIDEAPTDPSRVLTAQERARLRRDARREAIQQLGNGDPGVTSLAKQLFQERVQDAMDNRKLVDRKTLHEEMRAVSREWRGAFQDGDPYRDSPKELYADSFSALVNDPELVAKTAPTFNSLFQNYLDRKPEVSQIYREIQSRIEGGPQGVFDHRLGRYVEMVRRGGAARAGEMASRAREGAVTMSQALVDGLIDSKSALYRKVAEARKRGAALNPNDNPLHWLEEMSYHSSQASWYLHSFHEDVLGPVREAGVSDADFGAFLGLRRAAGERAEIFNPLGEQGDLAKDLQNHLLATLGQEKADAVVKGARRWWELRKEVLDQVEASGAFTKRLMRHARNHPEYVKFFVKLHMNRDSGSRAATGNIFRQIGTLQEIGNPVVETALADLALLRVAHRTQAAKSVVSFMANEFPSEIKPAKRGAGNTYAAPASRDEGTITFLEEGKAQAHYVSKRIASFFEDNPYQAGGVYKAYTLATRPLRALFVDRNPWWAAWNLYKDARAFAKQVITYASPGDSRTTRSLKAVASPIVASFETARYLAKAAPDAFGLVFGDSALKAAEYLERRAPAGSRASFASARRSLATYFRAHRTDYSEMLRGRMAIEMKSSLSDPYAGADLSDNGAVDALLKRYGVVEAPHHNTAVRFAERLWNWAGRPGEFTEKLTKLAGYKYLKANQARLGISDQEVGHRVRALVGTPDVMRRGDWFKFTNSVFLFSNVGKEGFRSAVEAAKLSPAEYAMKTLAFDVMPKIAMAAIAAGWAGDELKKWFGKVSEYDKSNFLIIPWGVTPSGKAVYTRIPYDHVGQLVSGLIWKTFSDRTKAGDLFQWMDQNFPYSPASLHPYIQGAMALKEYSKGHNPVDSYSGEPMIRDQRVFQAGGWRSHQAFLKALWGEVGLDVIHRFTTERPSEAASFLEKSLGLPIAGPALARFIKVSDYGVDEQLGDIREQEKTDSARRSLDLEAVIRKGLEEDPEASVYQLYHAARDAGLDPGKRAYFARRVKAIRARMSGDPYEKALSYSPRKETRNRIEDLRKENEPEDSFSRSSPR